MRKIVLLLLALSFLMPGARSEAQEVDILWQGEAYVPPFYKGKTLWSSQSKITFLAVQRGTGMGNPAGLTYKWTKNGTVLGNISGVGKNTLSFTDSVLSKPQTVRIDILSADQESTLASASVTVTPTAPVLAVYENNPLYGFMFHKETSGVHELQDQEVTFAVFPLFFSTLNRADNAISYEWRTDAKGEAEIRNSVTYRAPDDATGSSQVQVNASNRDKILQSSGKSFSIKFGRK